LFGLFALTNYGRRSKRKSIKIGKKLSAGRKKASGVRLALVSTIELRDFTLGAG